ncbi:transposase [Methylobacterium oryzae CBMB20]
MWVELLGRAERWRRWSLEDRVRIIQGSCVAGVSVCSVACRHGIAQGLLFTWRRQAREGRLGGDEQVPVIVCLSRSRPSRSQSRLCGLMILALQRSRVGLGARPASSRSILAVVGDLQRLSACKSNTGSRCP